MRDQGSLAFGGVGTVGSAVVRPESRRHQGLRLKRWRGPPRPGKALVDNAGIQVLSLPSKRVVQRLTSTRHAHTRFTVGPGRYQLAAALVSAPCGAATVPVLSGK